MKRCPQCNRVENDDTLGFCREDGTALISDFGSVSGGTDGGSTPVSGEIETSVLPHRTDAAINRHTAPTTVLPVNTPTSTTHELHKPKRLAAVMSLGALALLVAAVAGYFYVSRKTNTSIQSIAVMPFVNESGNAELEYLSDGMTESLINSLSQLPNLSVKARSTVFHFKGKGVAPQQVGSELSVQAVLNGRVTQHGDQLTLSLELVDAPTGDQIWGEQYNRLTTDLVALQSEIASDVSSKLRSKLSGAEVAKVAKNYTANPEAYQLYLKGRFYWNKRTMESLKQAVEFYRQAIDKDPTYALAYSGLAESYVLFPSYSVASAKDSMPQAKAAAMRALELDESLAEAHAALASYLNLFEWDRNGAEKEYRRAIELNPNYATAHHWLGADNLMKRKRFDEALVLLKRAQELDPLSPIISKSLGSVFYDARRYDEAIAQFNRTLALDQTFYVAHLSLGLVYHAKGMYREAIAEYRKADDLNDDPSTWGFLALSLAKSGQRDEATKLLNKLKLRSAERYTPSYAIAITYLGLNDKEQAFVWLEKEIDDHGYWANEYAIAPELDELRGDPRFKQMLKRLNLPE